MGPACFQKAWSRRQESNLYLPLRRRPFCPLNYGESGAHFGMRPCVALPAPNPSGGGSLCQRAERSVYSQRQVQIRSSELSWPDRARSVKRWAMRYSSCQLPVVAFRPRS